MDESDGAPDPDSATVAELVRRHWDGRAADFDEAPEHGIHSAEQHDRWLSVLRRWTDDEPRRVLDVGCGTGVVALLLAELGHDVTGVDAAPGMIERARRKALARGVAVELFMGDATALGLGDDAFEVLVERHLLWTLPAPRAAVDEWRRVVEPGGRIVLFEGRWDHGEPRGEYAEVHDELPMYDGRRAAELREFLATAGLVDVAAEPLTDPVLRGLEPDREIDHDYFVVAGTVPE